MTSILVIEKDDTTTSKNAEDYIQYNKDNIPTVTVKVNANRSKGRTFIIMRPRSDGDIYSDKVEMHRVAHTGEDTDCFPQCITCDQEEKERIHKAAAEARRKAQEEKRKQEAKQ